MKTTSTFFALGLALSALGGNASPFGVCSHITRDEDVAPYQACGEVAPVSASGVTWNG